MPKNEYGLQSVTAWVKTILGVRDLTSCHTPLSKQRANNGLFHGERTTVSPCHSEEPPPPIISLLLFWFCVDRSDQNLEVNLILSEKRGWKEPLWYIPSFSWYNPSIRDLEILHSQPFAAAYIHGDEAGS